MITHQQPRRGVPIDRTDRLVWNWPNLLCAIRLAGSFLLVVLALGNYAWWFLGVFLFLAATDWLDGRLAIWLDERTTFGARFDSVADAAMYGALLFGCVWLDGKAIAAEVVWIAGALACYAISCASSVLRFGRLPSHHTYSAKGAWAVTVTAAVILLAGGPSWPLRLSALAVAFANLESTSITLLSNRWLADVPTVWGFLRRAASAPVTPPKPTYEENLIPLPAGDFVQVFAKEVSAIAEHAQTRLLPHLTAKMVLQWANVEVQPYFGKICRRLLLPGSGIDGLENLEKLTQLASDGHSCILCLDHRSNLDVPTLYALLQDLGRSDLFDRLIWVAGRKLEEDAGATHVMVEAFNRVIVTPHSWLEEKHLEAELHEAHQINIAAHRAIHLLRRRGWVFALFPSGTRIRPNDDSTRQAIEETDSFLKNFEYLLLGHIEGCTMPVSRDHDLTHEVPVRDRMRYCFGPVLRTAEWRADAARRYPELSQRMASARAIVEDIATVSPTWHGDSVSD